MESRRNATTVFQWGFEVRRWAMQRIFETLVLWCCWRGDVTFPMERRKQ